MEAFLLGASVLLSGLVVAALREEEAAAEAARGAPSWPPAGARDAMWPRSRTMAPR
jgi:hypothetical protein